MVLRMTQTATKHNTSVVQYEPKTSKFYKKWLIMLKTFPDIF